MRRGELLWRRTQAYYYVREVASGTYLSTVFVLCPDHAQQRSKAGDPGWPVSTPLSDIRTPHLDSKARSHPNEHQMVAQICESAFFGSLISTARRPKRPSPSGP
ncbi:hypothetical protein GQ53DRAFT_860706 [Thozetella sp. PMI_491]|nr:hypothetical protein GQ53DRAFT_860706 [Thozetella sp. PMI_491]